MYSFVDDTSIIIHPLGHNTKLAKIDICDVHHNIPIRRHGSDVYLGMCPIKMATPILMY